MASLKEAVLRAGLSVPKNDSVIQGGVDCVDVCFLCLVAVIPEDRR